MIAMNRSRVPAGEDRDTQAAPRCESPGACGAKHCGACGAKHPARVVRSLAARVARSLAARASGRMRREALRRVRCESSRRVRCESSRRVWCEALRRVWCEALRHVRCEALRRVRCEASRRVWCEASRRMPDAMRLGGEGRVARARRAERGARRLAQRPPARFCRQLESTASRSGGRRRMNRQVVTPPPRQEPAVSVLKGTLAKTRDEGLVIALARAATPRHRAIVRRGAVAAPRYCTGCARRPLAASPAAMTP